MKQLFTIACTLVLGGALAFAQTSSPSGGQTPASGDQTQTKTGTSTTTKKHHHHGAKKSKKSKTNTDTTAAPAASPSPSPKEIAFYCLTGRPLGRPLIFGLQESFPFSSFSA
jgi:hypothetical protein